jgi:pimeloyl-ACP methyl ester carboxylesterase
VCAAVCALERRLDAALDRHGAPAAIVGHSRGGLFARALAQRRPDAVSAVVTLGSPWRDQLAVHPGLWMPFAALGAARALGIKGELGFGAALACRPIRDLLGGESRGSSQPPGRPG